MHNTVTSTRNWIAAIFAALAMGVMSPGTAATDEHWSYEGADGPEQWGNLSPEFDLCSEGKNQSPIDLSGTLDADLPALVFNYSNRGAISEVNNGHTVVVSVKPGNFVLLRDQKFEVKQFHFHSPSEHHIDGQSFPLEVHLVHANAAGELAVLGVLFSEGERNPLLDQLKTFRPPELGPPTTLVDYNELFSSRNEYYSYNGSLTTPPCSEGVRWVVLKQPVVASKDQIARFRNAMGFNSNRPIQPDNARIILE